MAGKTQRWTPENLELLLRITRQSVDAADLERRVAHAFSFPCTLHAARFVFRDKGLGPLSKHIAADLRYAAATPLAEASPEIPPPPAMPTIPAPPPEEPPIDPVEAQEQREEESRDKQQIKKLVTELRAARARQGFLDDVSAYRAPPRIYERERTSGLRELTAVVLASDWHVEEEVFPESVAYRNEYNLEIAAVRIERFFRSIIWNIEHHRVSGRLALHDMVLWLGGDLMTGYIHPELVENNLLSPTETIRWLLPRLRDGIATLLSHLDLAHLEIPCSYGNHGRTTDKPRIASGYSNSFEWLMYHSLSDEFRQEKRIHFEITNSPHQYVEVYGKTLHFHHGDDVKYNGGVGGLGIPLLKAVPMWDLVKKADVHNIGHHHTLRDYGSCVVNGSLIGYGPYSQRIRAPFEEPLQAMYFYDKVHGKCMNTPLWVADKKSDRARTHPFGDAPTEQAHLSP